MAALLLAWLLIGTLAVPAGWWLLARADAARTLDRVGDRAVAAAWLGLSACALPYAALSLAGPLLSWRSPALAALLCVALWSRDGVRAEARALRAALGAQRVAVGVAALAALAVAAHATQPVSNYDPGLYHYQHIQWLADTGVVRGLGLVHSRFGFAGSWFAWPALFDVGPMRARVPTLGGGLVMLLALWHWLLCVWRCLQRRARPADRFACVGLGLLLLYVIDKGWFNATSPDAPVLVLGLLCGWTMLLAPRAANALPLWFALCALGWKLSAAPLLLVAASHAGIRHTWRTIPWALPLAAVLVAQSFIANGCLAYPVARSCLDVDWGVGATMATRDAAEVLWWARWAGPPPAGADGNWWPSWLSAHDLELGLFAVAVLALALRVPRWRAQPGAADILLQAALCIGFGMLSAPDVRFFGGSLFALLGLAGFAWWPVTTTPVASRAQPPAWTGVAAGALLVAMTIVALAHKPIAVLLLPPRIEARALTLTTNASGLAYWRPMSGNQCWAAPLPCAPERIADTVRYRDPAAGPAGGFSAR